MTVTARSLGAMLLLGWLASCKGDSVTHSVTSLRFDPPALTFDAVYADGVTRFRDVTVINEGRSTLIVEWSSMSLPFRATWPDTLPPGATTVRLELQANTIGHSSHRVSVKSEGVEPASLALESVVKPIPVCPVTNPCLTATFDTLTERCVEQALEDGVSCEVDTKCQVESTCQHGQCLGRPRTCNDGNLCTVDVCYPQTGCEFLPAPPCPGDGACLEGVCDPALGCGLTAREDGTSCGSSQSCTAVQVCVAGSCVTRDPPDGHICAEASPCNGAGRCQGDVCVMEGTPQPLPISWSFDAMTPVAMDGPATQLHDFVLEPTGEMSLSGFFGVGAMLRANTASSVSAPDGPSRRCIIWNGRYVCADYPASPNGQVSALSLATGATLWTFNIHSARPDFELVASTIFLARLVVQGPDRLAAIFEAYPRNASGDTSTQCRRYFLAVIDAQGGLVQAQPLEDPLLDVCNHPHPYGVVADAQGNLFIAVSPTQSPQAPLVPSNTTLIMSYSPNGVFRWKRLNEGMRGGELAVARGLLYAEYTSVVVDATDGHPVSSLPRDLGRAVVSRTRLIPAPLEGSTAITAYEAGTSELRWTKQLPESWHVHGDQLRLARWMTSQGPRTVALTWLRKGTSDELALYGVTVHDGSDAFLCPLDGTFARTAPQLFEVANGSLGVLTGAMDGNGNPGCTKCDPPLAGSSGAFTTVTTPRLSIAEEPWVGTFGGAGHDHHEN